MKIITVLSLHAILLMMLVPNTLLSAEPSKKNNTPSASTQRATKRPAEWYGPPPAKKIVYKKIGERELSLHIFEPAGQKASDKRPAIVFFHGGAWAIGDPNQLYYQCDYLAK